jgi:2-polyprenyl-3-methyl-5-hydroxy-6-metoxy-1,4-benzoquinol methylase
VLDIGCGTGEISNMVIEMHPLINIDAVDFPEMIRIAHQQYKSSRINYIESGADEYIIDTRKYDFILSSCCLAAIRNPVNLKQTIYNLASMVKYDGAILMIEPFHKWNEYWRARIGVRDIVFEMEQLGFKLIYNKGFIFWPYRQWLAASNFKGNILARRINQGEKLLSIMGKSLWSDYKILLLNIIILIKVEIPNIIPS